MINATTTLQRLQPVVLVGERFLAPAKRSPAEGMLVTPSGAEHPLRCLCTIRTLFEHQHAVNRSGLESVLGEEMRRQRAANTLNALDYVVSHLAPIFGGLAWHSTAPNRPASAAPVAAPEVLDPPIQSLDLEEILGLVPLPPLLVPSLWVFGRVWMLHATRPTEGRLHVRLGSESLGCTGEFANLRTLDKTWERDVASYVQRRVGELQNKLRFSPDEALTLARAEFQRDGFWQRGDLLLVQTGEAAWIGHIVPAHYNHSLGRKCCRDLALMIPWGRPLRFQDLRVFECVPPHGWRPVALPNGLCLGPGPRFAAGVGASDPGVAVMAQLRWAVVRLAPNGLFHEHDVSSA
jgi:hypothetical protein